MYVWAGSGRNWGRSRLEQVRARGASGGTGRGLGHAGGREERIAKAKHVSAATLSQRCAQLDSTRLDSTRPCWPTPALPARVRLDVPNPKMAEPEASSDSRKRRRGQRSNRPCDPCRRRKTRCIVESGSAGECTVCLYRQTKCTYEESPPERPLPRRPSSTATSTSIIDAAQRHPPPGEVAHLSPGSGEIPRSAPALPPSTGVRTNEELPSDVLSSGEASAAALEAARERQRNGEPVSDADRAKGEKSLGLDSTRFAELYGLGSDMEPILMVRCLHLATLLPLLNRAAASSSVRPYPSRVPPLHARYPPCSRARPRRGVSALFPHRVFHQALRRATELTCL